MWHFMTYANCLQSHQISVKVIMTQFEAAVGQMVYFDWYIQLGLKKNKILKLISCG